MARSRNIKPALLKNEVLGTADPLYTILFEGLWLLADREGRLEDRPLRIKAETFPYREGLHIEEMLNWLQAKDFIVRYLAGGKAYIQVLNFKKHQNPHKNEPPSEIPPPDEVGATPDLFGTGTENIGSARADSLNLIPDSLKLIPDTATPVAAKPRLESGQDGDFEAFWEEYPRKQGKGAAERAFKKIQVTPDLTARIIGAIRQHKRSRDWLKDDGQYIPHPATWLNQRRWEDVVNTDSHPANAGRNGNAHLETNHGGSLVDEPI